MERVRYTCACFGHIQALTKPAGHQRRIGRDHLSAEARLLEQLRAGGEEAFSELVDRYGPSMLRVAWLYVRDQGLAQEIVQDTWVNVLRGLDRFEGRSSLRTWIFVILGNCARRRAERERGTIPFAEPHEQTLHAAVEPNQFFSSSHPRWPGAWSTIVEDWRGLPEDSLLSTEATAAFRAAVAELPARYAVVITLRDLDDWTAREVCDVLAITPENQRVLLHRARARVRVALIEYFGDEAS